MLMIFSKRNHRYSQLESRKALKTALWSRLSLRNIFAGFLVILCVAGAIYFAGRSSVRDQSLLTIPLATKSEGFHYDRAFGPAPSNISNRAWISIAPQRSAFAVFHQLHCLNSVREGYRALHDAALEGRKIAEDDLPMMSSPPHVRHYIDLLRHSLKCRPDTTIEVKDEKVGGVTGFGTRHQCRDWDQLLGWTRKWQTYMQDPRKEFEGHEHESHILHEHDEQNTIMLDVGQLLLLP